MAKVQVKFINTRLFCDDAGHIIKDVAALYGDFVDFKLHVARKDFDYLK